MNWTCGLVSIQIFELFQIPFIDAHRKGWLGRHTLTEFLELAQVRCQDCNIFRIVMPLLDKVGHKSCSHFDLEIVCM